MKRISFLGIVLMLIFSITDISLADFYEDRDFDGADLAIFAAAYGSIATSPNYNSDCDLIDDGDVDEVDLRGFSSFFGKTNINPPDAVGEVGSEGGAIYTPDGSSINVPINAVNQTTLLALPSLPVVLFRLHHHKP